MADPLPTFLDRMPTTEKELVPTEAQLYAEWRNLGPQGAIAMALVLLRRIADAIDRQTDVIRR